jgi:nucleotide-binding universal stress UspA family protein
MYLPRRAPSVCLMWQATESNSELEGVEAIEPAVPAAVFDDILCGVDGSRGSHVAACQAVAVSGKGGMLRFLAIHHTVGVGLSEQSALSEHRASKALKDAQALAGAHGVRASASLVSGARTGEILRAEAARHDLLVIGSHGGSRLGGIMLGATVTQVAHHCEQPLLIARRSVDQGDFPTSLLLATDGSDGSWAATRAAIRLASRRASEIQVVFVPAAEDRDCRRQVLAQRQVIEEAMGALPVIHAKAGAVPERICQVAQGIQASMIVIGRRGVHGVRALGSVSERVAHRAGCSVLLVPIPAPAWARPADRADPSEQVG